MSILSQIGIVLLIVCIILVLVRSNRQLAQAAGEGEHFVDEWALREKKKQELLEEKKTRSRQLEARKRSNQVHAYEGIDFDDELYIDETGYYGEDESGRKKEAGSLRKVRYQNEAEFPEAGYPEDKSLNIDKDGYNVPENVVPMKRTPPVSMNFYELDENRNPIRKIPVRHLPFTIGRDPDNDLVIDHLSVAREHCRIVSRNQTILMEDSGSRNKLAVGGNVAASTVLKDHLYIGIGDRELLVEMHDI